MINYQELKSWVLHERKLQKLEEEQNRIKNGYARVSKDGEVYLDFNDRRTQLAMQAQIKRFAELSD